MPQSNTKDTNYLAITLNHLKKQYPTLSDKETNILCREVIFAPQTYSAKINEKKLPITEVRENLADFIERDAAAKDFIPYSLDSEIADLIEQSNCETSSMNEYYRWVSATQDILQHMSDEEITHEDLDERKQFIALSNDREAELLLCLALYEGTQTEKNKEKIDLLQFKLARLREMRSIVRNTSDYIKHKHKDHLWQQYCQYCQELSKKDIPITQNLNLNLNINIDHSKDEDLDDNYSYFEYLQNTVLLMMRLLELPQPQNQHTENSVQETSGIELKALHSDKQQTFE